MPHARGRNEEQLSEYASSADGIEVVFPHLSERLDAVGEEMREVFLVKAFLLLADAHGDVRTALSCLEEAATSGHGRSRDAETL